MKIGIITVRDRVYHPNRRLEEAAVQKGHTLVRIHPYQSWPEIRREALGLQGALADAGLPDVVLPRQGATVGNSSMTLIRHLDLLGVPLVNGLDAIVLSRNQFLTLQTLSLAGIPVPDTLLVNAREGALSAAARLGAYPVVVKEVSGRQGGGVFLADSERDLQRKVQDHLDRRNGLLVQRFIPTEGRKDIRVLVLGERAVGAMELRPPAGDFRSNFHLSGESRAADLLPEWEETAVRACGALGLQIAGVDLIRDPGGRIQVIEVNYAPGFRGLESATGLDIAGCMVDLAVEMSRKG